MTPTYNPSDDGMTFIAGKPMTIGKPRPPFTPVTVGKPEADRWEEAIKTLKPFLSAQDVEELSDYLELASRRGFGEVTISLKGGVIDIMSLQLTKKKNKSGNSYS